MLDLQPQTSPSDSRYLLHYGIKSILRCDDAEVVSGIAKYVMTQYRVLKTGSDLMERTRNTLLPCVAALLGCLTRFLEVHEADSSQGIVWVARLGNERRAIARTIHSTPEFGWSQLKLDRPPDLAALSALIGIFRLGPGKIFRLTRLLHRKHQFFKVLRAVELIGYYARFLSILRNNSYQLAVVSSHSNPHGIAFNLAARRTALPVVLITHGMPVRPVAKLQWDLTVVHSEAARRTYVEEGCKLGQALTHGRRDQYRPMTTTFPERLVVGVFLCKDVNEARLRMLTDQLLRHARVSQVLLRPHPKNLWRGLNAWIVSRNESRLRRSLGGRVSADLQVSDIVLAGNSSVSVDAVTEGRPAAYVPGLDYGEDDMHQLVRQGLIPRVEISADHFDFRPDEILDFYQRPDWIETLRLFANIDENEKDVFDRVAIEMTRLVERKVARQSS